MRTREPVPALGALRRAVRALFAAPAALVLAAAPIGAQDADTIPLTLPAALERAREANPAYLRASNDLELRGVERRATWANEVLPRLSLALLETDYNGRLTRRAYDFFGNPIENPDAEFVYASGTRQGARLDWTIRGRSLFNALDRQDATEREREVGARAALREVETLVRRRFFDALEQEALLGIERDLAEARAVELELAERLFTLAASSRVDVLSARLEVERQRLRAGQQARQREQAILDLRAAIGDAELPPVEPRADHLPLFDPAGLDGDALVARALGESPRAAAAEAAVGAARVGVREAREGWWPELTTGFGIGRYVQSPQTDALFDVGGFGDQLYSSFNVGLSFPFFADPFGNRAREAAAAVALEDQRQTLRETRFEIERTVRSALVALRAQHETLVVAERALALAQEALELAREEYRLTTRTFEQLQQQAEQERQALREVVAARYGFLDALVTLEDAVGGEVFPREGAEAAPSGPPGA